MTASEARANLYELIEEVSQNSRRFVITHKGKNRVVMLPEEDIEAWEETLEIMSDKKLMKDIAEGEKDIKAGRVYTLDEVFIQPKGKRTSRKLTSK